MVDMATSRAIGSRSIYVANMFLWGPGFFTSSAFIMATIVERILRAMYGRTDVGRAESHEGRKLVAPETSTS
jgi:hypothetical protein